MTAIALLHKDKILRHLEQGGKLDDLNLGISRQAISKALKDDPDYQAAIIEYHASRLDTAEQAILDAADNVDVARARALHQAYSWRASVEQRRIWGQQDDRSSGGVTIVINTQDSTGRIIQGEGGVSSAGGEVLVPVPFVCADPSTAK